MSRPVVRRGGTRTSKKIGSAAKIDYTWEGSKLLCQGTGASRMIFVYDATGEVSGFTYGANSARYMYIKNLQGDVTGIMAASGKWSGQIVARYVYDTWGKLISIKNEIGVTVSASHIGSLNPIRYRSYYYDTETGLYYLQARYYDPETGRFINADSVVGNTGNSTYNLFVYCSNDPVNKVDPTGMCTYDSRRKRSDLCKYFMENYWNNGRHLMKGVSYYYNGNFLAGPIKSSSPAKPPSLTSAFTSADAAAAAFASKYFNLSKSTEYSSLIYEMGGSYYLLPAHNSGNNNNAGISVQELMTMLPDGSSVAAHIHSHPHNNSALRFSSEKDYHDGIRRDIEIFDSLNLTAYLLERNGVLARREPFGKQYVADLPQIPFTPY